MGVGDQIICKTLQSLLLCHWREDVTTNLEEILLRFLSLRRKNTTATSASSLVV